MEIYLDRSHLYHENSNIIPSRLLPYHFRGLTSHRLYAAVYIQFTDLDGSITVFKDHRAKFQCNENFAICKPRPFKVQTN